MYQNYHDMSMDKRYLLKKDVSKYFGKGGIVMSDEIMSALARKHKCTPHVVEVAANSIISSLF